ncbi:Glycosyl hydrolase family 30 TIM-barrel domain, partial [Phytophthora infestans]
MSAVVGREAVALTKYTASLGDEVPFVIASVKASSLNYRRACERQGVLAKNPIVVLLNKTPFLRFLQLESLSRAYWCVHCRYQTNLKGVCVCNATQCETVSNDYKTLTEGQVGVYTSSNAGDRFAYKVVNVDATAASNPTFTVDVSTQYQTMVGFGGSFTDAAAINVYKLSSTLQQMVLDQYYSEKGLQYSLGRVTSGSTDFSTSIYSYNDNPGDLAQAKFSIDVDRKSNKIDLIQRALRTSTRD